MPLTQPLRGLEGTTADLSATVYLNDGEILINECDHESLIARPDFQEWVGKVVNYVVERVGRSPRFRMYAYERGGQTIIALDIFGEERCNDLAITVEVSPGMASLICPLDDQLDIALPCIKSVMALTCRLANYRQGDSLQLHQLEVLPWVE